MEHFRRTCDGPDCGKDITRKGGHAWDDRLVVKGERLNPFGDSMDAITQLDMCSLDCLRQWVILNVSSSKVRSKEDETFAVCD